MLVELVWKGEDVDVSQRRKLVGIARHSLLDGNVEPGVVDAGVLTRLDMTSDLGVLLSRL